MLPRLDGWAVLARLREKKSTPVIMLTARDATRDRVRGFDTGADDYLVKPFELDELLARLRALIRRSAGRATPCLLYTSKHFLPYHDIRNGSRRWGSCPRGW